jgi:hypothetical protein
VTTSRCWLGISAPAWLKESDTPQVYEEVFQLDAAAGFVPRGEAGE